MTIAAWVALSAPAWAQDDGNIGQVGQGLVAGDAVDLATQQRLGLVTVSGGCSGTLVNRYWVLTAHHCVSQQNVLGGALVDPSTVTVTAAWSDRVVVPTRIETYAFTDGLDVALLFLGRGDFGPADIQLFYTPPVDTFQVLRKYGRGLVSFASEGPPPVPATPSDGYRTALFVPLLADETSYVLPANSGGQVGNGGDSGGPDIVMSEGIELGIVGVQSTCWAAGWVTGMPQTWTWATDVTSCTSAALYTIRDDIVSTIQEVPFGDLFAPPPAGPPIWLYAVTQTGALMWSRQDGTGTPWAWPTPVGSGWDTFVDVLPAGGNSIFGITGDGLLYWYRHDGFNDGTFAWTGGIPINSGWTFPTVFGGGDGVLYAIDDLGQLWWYRYDDFATGSDPSAWSGPALVGWGWDQFSTVVSTGDGAIYAVLPNGDLWLYHHDGFTDGTFAWSDIRQVSTGWDRFEHVIGVEDSVLLGIEPDGTLLWHQHLGLSGVGAELPHEVWDGPHAIGGGLAGLRDVFALLPTDPGGVR
jgi:hypothetical protein